MLDNLFLQVLTDLQGGYLNTYVFDCAIERPETDPQINFEHICDAEEFQPLFTLYKPAEIKLNPYTGKQMPMQAIPWSSNAVSDPDVKNWITNNIPDYTQRLSQMQDAEQFADEDGIS